MKRIVLQILLGVSGLLMVSRFGGPALIFGATGPGPFGNRWLLDGRTATLLLDADLRFFGAMLLGLGVLFLLTILRVEALGSVIYILACAAALARRQGCMRAPHTAIPGLLTVESVIPFFLILDVMSARMPNKTEMTSATDLRPGPS